MSVVSMLLNVVGLKCSASVHVALPAAANVAAACSHPLQCYIQCSIQNAVKSVGRSAMQCTAQLPQATLALICSNRDKEAIALVRCIKRKKLNRLLSAIPTLTNVC